MSKKILLVGLLACLAFSTPLALAADDSPSLARVAARYLQKGKEFLDAGRYVQAAEHFEAALTLDPGLEAARDGLAKARANPEAQGEPEPEPAAATPAAHPAEPDPPRAAAEPAPAGPTDPPAKPEPAPAEREPVRLADVRAKAEGLVRAGTDRIAEEQYEEARAKFDHALELVRPFGERFPKIAARAREGLRRARAAQMDALAGRFAETTADEPPPAARPDQAPDRPPADQPAGAERKIEADPDLDRVMMDADRMVGSMVSKDLDPAVPNNPAPEPLSVRLGRTKRATYGLVGGKTHRSADEEKVRMEMQAKLKTNRVDVQFDNKGFEEAMDYLRAVGEINVVVDPAIRPTLRPVTLLMNDAPVENVLNYLVRLQDAEIDWAIRDGAVFISNAAGLADQPVAMWHDIADLTVHAQDFQADMADAGFLTPKFQRQRDQDWFGRQMAKDDVKDLSSRIEGAGWTEFVKNTIAPHTWSSEGGVGQNRIAYRSGKLVVTHSPEVQEQIRELLASFRKARAVQVAILARFIEVNEDFLEELSLRWTNLGPDRDIGIQDTAGTGYFEFGFESSAEVAPSAAFGHQDTAGMRLETGFLRTWEVWTIIEAVRKNRKGNILTAPRVTCFNTQRAFVTVSTRRSYIRTFDENDNPEIGQVNSGITLEVQPFVSADRQYITLELKPQVNVAGELQRFAYSTDITDDTTDDDDDDDDDTDDDTGRAFVQLPQVTTRQVMTTVSVPDGGTLLIGGLAQAKESEGYATIPIIGDIPILNRLFRAERKITARNNLIVLVTAHIIEQEE